MGLHQFKGFYINVSYTTNCMLHIFSYYWPLIHYSVSVYINLIAYGFGLLFLKSVVKQASATEKPLRAYPV